MRNVDSFFGSRSLAWKRFKERIKSDCSLGRDWGNWQGQRLKWTEMRGYNRSAEIIICSTTALANEPKKNLFSLGSAQNQICDFSGVYHMCLEEGRQTGIVSRYLTYIFLLGIRWEGLKI